MYINPFFAGVVSTILVEVALIAVFFITHVVAIREVDIDDEQNRKH